MKCPNCFKDDNTVTETRTRNGKTIILRRRKCFNCGYRFTTKEKWDGKVETPRKDAERNSLSRLE